MKEQKTLEIGCVDNKYTALAEYYDNLMTSGYYDYKIFATSLYDILGKRKNILDIGIGTGLLTEQMLLLHEYQITGIDFSPAMLAQTEARLKDTSVRFVCADIQDYKSGKTFEAIISTGGTLCISYKEEEKQYRLYSYCCDKDAYIKLLNKLYNLLEKNGILCISIQGEHTDYEIPIKNGIMYAQETNFMENSLQKTYTFSLDGTILNQQSLQLIFFDERELHDLFTTAGFFFVGTDRTKKFCTFRKI